MKKKKLPAALVTFQPNEKNKININMTEFARKIVRNEPLSSNEIVRCILNGY